MVVAKATQNQHKQWTMTFTNGQQWKQVGNDTFKLKVGDKVTISRGFLNSFNLKKVGSNRMIKVKRAS
jgi:superfamily I DNA and RNA helicase